MRRRTQVRSVGFEYRFVGAFSQRTKNETFALQSITNLLTAVLIITSGCQDAVTYLRVGNANAERQALVAGLVLQAPVSDREYMATLPNTQYSLSLSLSWTAAQSPFPHKLFLEMYSFSFSAFRRYLELAEKLIREGKAEELLPREADVAPITAYRYHSLAARMGDDGT